MNREAECKVVYIAENRVKIMPRAVVCEESYLVGDITIATGCVIHPNASILAESGPIILSENCVVEEYATIINQRKGDLVGHILHIGPNNIFEIGCHIGAISIGERNIFESKCVVDSEVSISSNCIVGAAISVCGRRHLKENTVIFSNHMLREAVETQSSQALQIDFLRKVLPNYHHLRKSNVEQKKLKMIK